MLGVSWADLGAEKEEEGMAKKLAGSLPLLPGAPCLRLAGEVGTRGGRDGEREVGGNRIRKGKRRDGTKQGYVLGRDTAK